MKYKAHIFVRSRDDVPDPTRINAVSRLSDVPQIADMRSGKYITADIEADGYQMS